MNNELPGLECPLCSKVGMHSLDCPAAILQLCIEDRFLYGGKPAEPLGVDTFNEFKDMASRHKIVVLVGDVDNVPKRLADLVFALGDRVDAQVMTLKMLKERTPGEAALVLCDDDEAQGLSDLIRPPIVPQLIVGHRRALAAEEFRHFSNAAYAEPVKFNNNRSDTGRHGPYDSFHRKKKKGRR